MVDSREAAQRKLRRRQLKWEWIDGLADECDYGCPGDIKGVYAIQWEFEMRCKVGGDSGCVVSDSGFSRAAPAKSENLAQQTCTAASSLLGRRLFVGAGLREKKGEIIIRRGVSMLKHTHILL